MLLLLSSICFLVIGYLYGFYQRRMWEKLKGLEHLFDSSHVHVEEPPKPSSGIIEAPLTPAEKVQREQEELLERLNP